MADDNEQVAASSAGTETAVTDASPAQESSTGAAEGAKTTEPTSYREAALQSLGQTEATPADENEDAVAKTTGEQAAAKDESAKATPPADPAKTSPDSDVPSQFNEHPAWKRIIGERNTAREQLQTLTPKGEEFDKITSYMETNGLAPQEVAQGYEIMALIKNDPVKAYERLQQVMAPLMGFVGEKLPVELQEKVDAGLVDIDTAKALVKEQSQATFLRQQMQGSAARQQQAGYEREAQSRIQAGSGWESSVRAKDPDYARIAGAVQRAAKAALRDAEASGQPPRTPQDVVSLLEKAYQEVKQEFKSLLPSRPTVTSTTSTGSSTTAKPVPKTFREAAMQSLEAHHASGGN